MSEKAAAVEREAETSVGREISSGSKERGVSVKKKEVDSEEAEKRWYQPRSKQRQWRGKGWRRRGFVRSKRSRSGEE